MSHGTILGQTPAVEPFDPKAINVQFDSSKGQGIVTSSNVQGAIEQLASKDKNQDSTISSLNSSVSGLRNLFDSYEIDGRITKYTQNQSVPTDRITQYYIPWDWEPSTSHPSIVLIEVTNWSPPSYTIGGGGGSLFLLGEDIDKIFSSYPGEGTGIVLTTESKSNYNYNNAYSTKNLYYNNFLIDADIGRQLTYWNNFTISSFHGNRGGTYSAFGPEICSGPGNAAIGNFNWDTSNFYFSLFVDNNTYSSLGIKVFTFNRKKS